MYIHVHVRISVPSFIKGTIVTSLKEGTLIRALIHTLINLFSILAGLLPVLSKHWVDSVSKLVQSGDTAELKHKTVLLL